VGRTLINLAPADLKKDAGSFDLPITLALLVATRQLLPENKGFYKTAWRSTSLVAAARATNRGIHEERGWLS
jgi:hypothetical protein